MNVSSTGGCHCGAVRFEYDGAPLFGGAGAVEAMACVRTVYTDNIHPTINLDFPDPECDLDYVPHVARKAEVNAALSNSFGLGGQNATLIVGKFRE